MNGHIIDGQIPRNSLFSRRHGHCVGFGCRSPKQGPTMPKPLLIFALLLASNLSAHAENENSYVVEQRIGVTTVVQRRANSVVARSSFAKSSKQTKTANRPLRIKGFQSMADFVHYVLGFQPPNKYVSSPWPAAKNKHPAPAQKKLLGGANKRIGKTSIVQ